MEMSKFDVFEEKCSSIILKVAKFEVKNMELNSPTLFWTSFSIIAP